MQTQIRTGTFETNSSSMHSLVVTKITGKYTPEELRKDVYINGGMWDLSCENLDFGRGFDILNTFEAKVRYAIAEFCGENYPDNFPAEEYSYDNALESFRKIEEVAKKAIPEIDGIKLGASFYEDPSAMEFGGIDHQSAGFLKDFLKRNEISLEDFLTRREYWVIIDGDESYMWDKMEESGQIDTSQIEYEERA